MFKLILSVMATALLASSVQAFTGDATFFFPGLGACGRTNKNSDLIVALNPVEYAKGANCFRNIDVHYKGKSVRATVVDLCPSCADGSIDLSPAAFDKLAPESVGRLHGVQWNFV
ncbi:RlpA-like double-psi beta-barrel-protein domain-containing protein-containing protein [Trametes meyenii]|nr:RlpA-like double-psi beta-barrel-protein domain-containing protein-containing protein [Trametes meyenii]